MEIYLYIYLYIHDLYIYIYSGDTDIQKLFLIGITSFRETTSVSKNYSRPFLYWNQTNGFIVTLS